MFRGRGRPRLASSKSSATDHRIELLMAGRRGRQLLKVKVNHRIKPTILEISWACRGPSMAWLTICRLLASKSNKSMTAAPVVIATTQIWAIAISKMVSILLLIKENRRGSRIRAWRRLMRSWCRRRFRSRMVESNTKDSLAPTTTKMTTWLTLIDNSLASRAVSMTSITTCQIRSSYR